MNISFHLQMAKGMEMEKLLLVRKRVEEYVSQMVARIQIQNVFSLSALMESHITVVQRQVTKMAKQNIGAPPKWIVQVNMCPDKENGELAKHHVTLLKEF